MTTRVAAGLFHGVVVSSIALASAGRAFFPRRRGPTSGSMTDSNEEEEMKEEEVESLPDNPDSDENDEE